MSSTILDSAWLVAIVDREWRTIWIVNAYGYGKRFMLTVFLELERAIHQFAVNLILE